MVHKDVGRCLSTFVEVLTARLDKDISVILPDITLNKDSVVISYRGFSIKTTDDTPAHRHADSMLVKSNFGDHNLTSHVNVGEELANYLDTILTPLLPLNSAMLYVTEGLLAILQRTHLKANVKQLRACNALERACEALIVRNPKSMQFSHEQFSHGRINVTKRLIGFFGSSGKSKRYSMMTPRASIKRRIQPQIFHLEDQITGSGSNGDEIYNMEAYHINKIVDILPRSWHSHRLVGLALRESLSLTSEFTTNLLAVLKAKVAAFGVFCSTASQYEDWLKNYILSWVSGIITTTNKLSNGKSVSMVQTKIITILGAKFLSVPEVPLATPLGVVMSPLIMSIAASQQATTRNIGCGFRHIARYATLETGHINIDAIIAPVSIGELKYIVEHSAHVVNWATMAHAEAVSLSHFNGDVYHLSEETHNLDVYRNKLMSYDTKYDSYLVNGTFTTPNDLLACALMSLLTLVAGQGVILTDYYTRLVVPKVINLISSLLNMLIRISRIVELYHESLRLWHHEPRPPDIIAAMSIHRIESA